MKIIFFISAFVAAVLGAQKYYDLLLTSERLRGIIERYGYGGYWGALLLPGIIAGVALFPFILARLQIKLLASIFGGCVVIAIGLFGSTIWCILRGVGSCI